MHACSSSPSCLPAKFVPLLTFLLILILFCSVLAPNASAQTDSWLGGTGNWSVAQDWSLGQLPQPSNDCLIPAGSNVTDDAAGTCNNFTMAAGALSIAPAGAPSSYLDVFGSSITNSASITVTQSGGLNLVASSPTTVPLSGGGTVTLSSNGAHISGCCGNTLMNVDHVISGFGALGMGSINVINQKTVVASGGTLVVQGSTSGTAVTNTGLMQATTGSTLQLISGFLNTPFNNAGGTIQALAGGAVQVGGSTFTGGTFTSTGTGNFFIVPGNNTILNNLTNAATYNVQAGANTTFQGTITNTGTFQALGGGILMNGNVTLTGSGNLIGGSGQLIGTFSGSGTNTFTNQSAIQGGGTIGDSSMTLVNLGTINANNASNPLVISGAAGTNTSTMEATNGGSLEIQNTINNAGGTITAQNSSTVILLGGGIVSGGALTATGSGTLQSQNGTLDGTTNTPTITGLFNVASQSDLNLQGTITNNGTIALNTNGGCLIMLKPTTIAGTGKVTMNANNCMFGSGNSLTNQSTIQGAGTIGDSNPMPITNAGTILANVAGGTLTIVPDASGLTNNSKLIVKPGSTLNINGKFNNFANQTLSGGTYTVMGTLEFQNAAIQTNNGNITLMGTSGQILDSLTGTNALKTLTTNSTRGLLSLQSGAALTTTTKVTNKGKTTVGASSTLSLGSSYTQSAGTTTVDGTLTAPTGLTISSGSLVGKGTLTAAVTSSATLAVGDSTTKAGKLTITGAYTQNSTGTLNVAIGGTTVGTQYSQLAVSNGIALNGTLNIKLINNFIPTIGSTFTILTGSAISSQFTTVNGLSINSTEHFQINYGTTAVTLTVQPGP